MRCGLTADEDKSVNLSQLFPGQIAQLRHARNVRLCVRAGAGCAEAADAGHIFRAGAVVALLSAAVYKRGEGQAGTDIKRARAFGGMDLVRGDGDHVRAERFGAEWNLQKALHGVGMEQRQRGRAAHGLDHVGNRHDRARLVVDHHDGDENGIGPEGLFQFLDCNIAVVVRLQICDLEALRFQLLHGVQDSVVLHGGRDDVAAALAETLGGGKNGPVVGLRAAGGEKHPVGLCAEGGGDRLPRLPQTVGGVNTEGVDGRRIAPAVRERLCHGPHAGGAGLRGGGIVEIDHSKT